jgi:Lon protease-like protein
MPRRLPLFPLQLVLCPGEPLPLHIFEPRYRQMLADCLGDDERFGLVLAPQPAAGTVGCVAHIRGSNQLPDGRSNIVVVGERRFTVQALVDEDTPYLLGMVEEFDDAPGSEPLPAESVALRELAEQYRESLRVLADSPGDLPPWSEEPELFSFQVAALAELDPDEKQPLLQLRSTGERTRRLLELLPPLVRVAAARAEVHVRARSNGKGGVHHDIIADG